MIRPVSRQTAVVQLADELPFNIGNLFVRRTW